MSDNLLSVPLKNTTETDLVTPFKNLFAVCNVNVTKNFDRQLAELNKLRSEVIPKNINKSQAGLDALARYHDQIQVLEGRIPSEGLNIQFVWEDAFDTRTLLRSKASTSLPFLTFERQCVLFNIATLQSILASEFRTSDSDEDLKTVAKWFQQAAGIFAHLSSSISILSNHNLTLDLSSNTLEALSILMLAQAQEIFVTKAINDRMKDPIVAKLSIQAQDMFSEALLKMTKETVKHQWDRNWLTNVAGKKLAYEALAQYFQSKACAAKKRVGEQISRLSLCLELLQKIQDKLQNPNLYSFYVTEANRLMAEAKKDNDFIYHEQVPPSDNLSTIEKVISARLAKPTPVLASQQFSSSFKDLFEELQPLSVCTEKLASLALSKSEIYSAQSTEEHRNSTDSPDESGAKPVNAETDPNASPLKLAIDASLNAVGYYMQQYLQGGRKSE